MYMVENFNVVLFGSINLVVILKFLMLFAVLRAVIYHFHK